VADLNQVGIFLRWCRRQCFRQHDKKARSGDRL